MKKDRAGSGRNSDESWRIRELRPSTAACLGGGDDLQRDDLRRGSLRWQLAERADHSSPLGVEIGQPVEQLGVRVASGEVELERLVGAGRHGGRDDLDTARRDARDDRRDQEQLGVADLTPGEKLGEVLVGHGGERLAHQIGGQSVHVATSRF